MPDSTTEKTIWRIVIDALTAAPVALGLDLVFKNVMRVSADKAVELAKARMEAQKEIARKREEILQDLRIMTQNDPQTTNNLWRRYAEAKADLAENRFIALLGEIYNDPTEGRRPTLAFLNGVDDARFCLCLDMLEHDYFMEWIHRIRRNAGRVTAKEYADLKQWIGGVYLHSKNAVRVVAQKNDDAAGKFAKIVGKFADLLS